MWNVPEEYKEEVLDNLKNYEGLGRPVKACFLERVFIHSLPLDALHPNPDDEFSDPEIGPNYSIVSDYARDMTRHREYSPGPIIVEKMSTGGYMILNGHHRWMAAKRVGYKRLPVRIVNMIHEDEIIETAKNSPNRMCVSFDLDEVLGGSGHPADPRLHFPMNRLYPEQIRKNTGVMITELERLGFDVWVYTGGFSSAEHIRGLLRKHGARVTGVVNGLKGRRRGEHVKRTFSSQYSVYVHADNESVLWVVPETGAFDSYDVSPGEEWARDVTVQIKRLLEKQGSDEA